MTGTLPINGTGNALANKITGNDGINKLLGLDGNDTIDAGSGNDTITGGKGDDSIIGGGGTDMAIFTGKMSEYTVTVVDADKLLVAVHDKKRRVLAHVPCNIK